jgi:pimeloyl-ACP methyl ester carboxylesterase
VVLYLHGNAGTIASDLDEDVELRNFGASVLTIDYRGYGRSTHRFPSEAGVYQDAEAAWRYLVDEKKIKPEEIIIYGHSLGGAVAIELASHHPEAGGLIAESTFTSIEDVARQERVYAAFPIHFLVTQRFASLSKISTIRIPILFIHGTSDELVPYQMSERLYQAASGAKHLVLIEGAGHEDCASTGGDKYRNGVQQFLKESK